jgi:hypothetical protein
VSVVYNCCWSSPAQSFSGRSPAGLMTIFYSLRFQTFPTWRARSPYLYPRGTGRPGYTPRHWVPFSSPPTTRRATVEVFDPASTWVLPEPELLSLLLLSCRTLLISTLHGPHVKQRLILARICVCSSIT